MAFEDPTTPGSSDTPAGSNHDGERDTPASSTPSSPASTPSSPASTPSSPASDTERRGIVVRRAPKFVPFMVLGASLGIVIAAFVAYGLPGDPSFERSAVFGFFSVAFGAGGVGLGAITALILDRLSTRRAESAVVEAVPESTPEEPEA